MISWVIDIYIPHRHIGVWELINGIGYRLHINLQNSKVARKIKKVCVLLNMSTNLLHLQQLLTVNTDTQTSISMNKIKFSKM